MTERAREAIPTILIVGMQNSVHVARWISMLRGGFARIVVFPVHTEQPAPELRPWLPVSSLGDVEALAPGEVGVVHLSKSDGERYATWKTEREAGRLFPPSLGIETNPSLTLPDELITAIRALRPDIVHTMEVQLAGYLALGAKRYLGNAMPPWLLSNWGSDIYLYHRLPEHRPIVLELVQAVDGYLAECRRDVQLVRRLGLKGHVFDPMPASGGIDFSTVPALDRLTPPSRRDTILVKGYHGWSGRGMHILSALHLAAPALRSHRIRVQFCSAAMLEMMRAMAESDGLDIAPVPYAPTHEEALSRIADARIVVGIGISDGIGTTLLEAMCYGAFPIKATTSCACEWIRNGRDGIIVDPHDVKSLAEAIVQAALDDALVDAAAPRNRACVEGRWDVGRNKATGQSIYRHMLGDARRAAMTAA
ncbi:glycosyltransferase [Methylobacterium sp. R2-1]|uniref:glycosyltransferase n=1 Tax=Methylobacterium sp. R2-1 TaxID=2587064 RepID=UPI00161B2DCB|nr:glycosyltransferase [Methylobacterium sp. R2-1]MBB2961779.1 glycosyltransferase involved in cell wall biosynthesis [Methylobacterium sp. R2-1]